MSVPMLSAQIHRLADAPVLILGPSLGTSTLLWDRAGSLLREHFTTIEWDLPGHGRSQPAVQPFTVTELADAVITVADQADAAQVCYAGVSLAGAVGLELALRYPERLTAVAMICSAAKLGDQDDWLQRADTVRRRGTAIMVDGSARRWFAPDFISANPQVASALLHALSDADDESYALCCEALARFDRRADLRRIDVPMLALAGEFDEVAPLEKAQAVADQVRNGVAVEIAGAAHLAPAEQPQVVADRLTDFFT